MITRLAIAVSVSWFWMAMPFFAAERPWQPFSAIKCGQEERSVRCYAGGSSVSYKLLSRQRPLEYAQYSIRRFGPPPQRGLPFPDVPASSPQRTAPREISNADLGAAIRSYIDSERKRAADKKFHINYRGKDLALDLIGVYDDPLSSLGGGKYFAAVEMKAVAGPVYDIDFFVTGQPGSMKVTEISVHKINGKPLYNWKEQGGVWKRVRVS